MAEKVNLNNLGRENNTGNDIIKCDGDLEQYKIQNRIFKDKIDLMNMKATQLKFENCIFQDIKMSEINIENINFVDCRINGELRLYNCKFQQLSFRSCNLINQVFIEQSLRQGFYSTVHVISSHLNEFFATKVLIDEIGFLDSKSSCNWIEITEINKINSIRITGFIGRITATELPNICLDRDGKVERIELTNGIKEKELRLLEKNISSTSKKDLNRELVKFKTIVLACYLSFESKKKFSEADICLFEIRRLDLMAAKATKSFPTSIFYSIEKFFIEICFGWGIKIKNNILSMLSVIVGFSLIYYGVALSLRNSISLGFIKCFQLAVNRFFIVSADEYDYTILGYFDTIESVMAVILLTVITGVILRKIIR